MKCGIRLSPCENSIAVITDDGDFVYHSSFKPTDTYSELLVQLESALKHCSNKYDIKLPVGVSIKGHETTSTGMITSLHHPLIAQKTLRRDLQAALKHSILVASDGQCLAVAARSMLQLHNKQTIFALSLDQSVCGGVIVSDKLLFGPHGLAETWDICHFPGRWIVNWKDGYVFVGEQAVLNILSALKA